MADFEVILGQNSKKKACSTNGSLFDVRCKKNQRKKFFIENLHAVVTFPLHYFRAFVTNYESSHQGSQGMCINLVR